MTPGGTVGGEMEGKSWSYNNRIEALRDREYPQLKGEFPEPTH